MHNFYHTVSFPLLVVVILFHFFFNRFLQEIKQSILLLKHGFQMINSQNRRFVITFCAITSRTHMLELKLSTELYRSLSWIFIHFLQFSSIIFFVLWQVAKLSLQTGFTSEYTWMAMLENDDLKKVKESGGTKVCIKNLKDLFPNRLQIVASVKCQLFFVIESWKCISSGIQVYHDIGIPKFRLLVIECS